MSTSACSRKLLSSLLGPTVSVGGLYYLHRERSNKNFSFELHQKFVSPSTFCDGSHNAEGTIETGPKNPTPTASLRKRMTSIGHFTLKSETPYNLSIPTFFIALSGQKSAKGNVTSNSHGSRQVDFTVSDLESIWISRDMPNLHPRFHSKVCSSGEGFFIQNSSVVDFLHSGLQKPRILHDHAKETIHPYHKDLQKRIEYLLTHPLDVSQRLWEVYISNGPLGKSGTISATKVAQYIAENNIESRETLLLFRAHHSIADGVSLVAALGDLVDEADDIRHYIEDEIKRRKRKTRRLLEKIGAFLRFLFGAIIALTRQIYLVLRTWNRNPFLRALNVSSWDEARSSINLDDSSLSTNSTRSVSWCEVGTVSEAKAVAKAAGSRVTLNDVFVSCVTRAIAKQLTEHRSRAQALSTSAFNHESKDDIEREHYINVVVPVHLFGGIHYPGSGMGNRIGAFVARVPCEEQGDSLDNTQYSAIHHLLSVHSSLKVAKNSPAPLLSYFMAKMATYCLPSSWVSYLFRQMNANAAVVVTNTRGFPHKVHIDGRRVEAAAGFFPLPPGLPVGVVVQSYDDIVSISVTAERWAVPDADQFLEWILDEFTNLQNETKTIRMP